MHDLLANEDGNGGFRALYPSTSIFQFPAWCIRVMGLMVVNIFLYFNGNAEQKRGQTRMALILAKFPIYLVG